MMDLCEFGPWWQDFSAWDDKLHAMTLDARRFCEDHKIPPCTIEEWSTLPQPSFILVNALLSYIYLQYILYLYPVFWCAHAAQV